MEDYGDSDDEYYISDEDPGESMDGIESEDSDVPGGKRSTAKVITSNSLLAAQTEDLRRVMELLSIREQHARTLLIHYRWDVEKIISVLVEKGKTCLYMGAGVMVDHNSDNSIRPCSSSTVTCEICMEDVPADMSTSMDCGHCFCNDCWTEHFIVKINEGQSRRIRCMAHKCNAICDEAVVRNLVKERHPDLAEKFERFLLESYIEDNKTVKWCPSVPHCGNAIRVEEDDVCEVECACGLQFCFNCLSEAHSPCSCMMWKLWNKKCKDDSETVNWMTVHTKPCPKCQKPVEKNGGCNLVCCVCGQPFCWLCGGPTGTSHTWDSIAGHSCGRYKEDAEQKTARAKRDLYRYMHYYNRYKAHTDSSKLENKLEETIKGRVSVSGDRDCTLRDFSWATSALNRLFRSRRVLLHSYAFAYYMFGLELFEGEMTAEDREIKLNLFEDQQQQLEANVERLSKYLEEPFDMYSADKLMETRMQVINLTVATDLRCKRMFECIENDLLGSLQLANHTIAPYNSNGIEKASELSTCSDASDCLASDAISIGGTTKREKPSGSGTSNAKKECSLRKRVRKEVSGFFDLNIPAGN
ncbi:Probable E3 ubiquitin-protein ligase ARI1 [Linum grandiflorum]